jgi:hypothetical protein
MEGYNQLTLHITPLRTTSIFLMAILGRGANLGSFNFSFIFSSPFHSPKEKVFRYLLRTPFSFLSFFPRATLLPSPNPTTKKYLPVENCRHCQEVSGGADPERVVDGLLRPPDSPPDFVLQRGRGAPVSGANITINFFTPILTRVSRWYILRPKIPIWVNFGGTWNRKGWYIL